MPFSILTTADPRWDTCFDKLPSHQRDIFYSSAFARVCQRTINRHDDVLCAKLHTQNGVILYPFARRNLTKVSGFKGYENYFDITSLYGRGGVVGYNFNSRDMEVFNSSLFEYCRASNIVCRFDRFHPVMANQSNAPAEEKIINVGGFVVVDLKPNMSDIINSFKSSVRKDLRKAERNQIICFSEKNLDHFNEFLDIYNHTMNRNSANKFYYFDREYFKILSEEMSDNFHYFYALSKGKIVSCELVLHNGKYCHSFLGGTKQEALALSANPILKLEILKLCKALGCEYFLLGGGTTSGDGIFNFKKAYAPNGIYPSYVGGVIYNELILNALKNKMLSTGALINENRIQFYDNE